MCHSAALPRLVLGVFLAVLMMNACVSSEKSSTGGMTLRRLLGRDPDCEDGEGGGPAPDHAHGEWRPRPGGGHLGQWPNYDVTGSIGKCYCVCNNGGIGNGGGGENRPGGCDSEDGGSSPGSSGGGPPGPGSAGGGSKPGPAGGQSGPAGGQSGPTGGQSGSGGVSLGQGDSGPGSGGRPPRSVRQGPGTGGGQPEPEP